MIIKREVAEELSNLKEQPGQDILMFGSGTLAHTLMERDLIDEYRLWSIRSSSGSGKRLFSDGSTAKLTLAETRPFDSGAVLLSYRKAEGGLS